MANVNKVERELGEALNRAYYEASEITISSDWRIRNLVSNATAKNTYMRRGEAVFKYAKGQLTYIVPIKFLDEVQMAVLMSVVGNPVKVKK